MKRKIRKAIAALLLVVAIAVTQIPAANLKASPSASDFVKDGTKLVTYESISFGRMSEQQFRTYVKEQLPFIYENVIGAFFKGEIYDSIISTIENDYERFFDKLK